MSMQSATSSGAGFIVLPEISQQQFRLLELPPELLEVLAGPDAKAIQFKSGGPFAGVAEASNAALCTRSKTYNVRQVNTSNSVYITQLHASGNGDGPPIPCIQAIAKADFTYELSKANVAPDSTIPYIKAALPIYSSSSTYQSKDLIAKAELYTEIPYSDLECDIGWRHLACFELDDPKGCFLPSGEAKLQAWTSIIQRSHEFQVDLTETLLDGLDDTVLVDPTTDWPDALTKAILRSLALNRDTSERIELDEFGTIAKAGLWNLEATTQIRGSIKLSRFVAEWKDLLPERWREKASLEYLRDQYELVHDGKEIKLASARNGSGAVKSDSGPAAARSLGAKRKWHEKFRASKKTA